ncbi:cobalt/nickel transport system permease protein [Cohaesibacter marisflavi]|uniref:Cobalt/nickel transport system permease protein n=1 Tax=Cohaesibacter marisflavi TaxID=655353 RepID=A0A1I5ARB3_9HYPH|nr:cobalt transporter CbiM [Cohaesibacter marisflavi]SFN65004.1 cobalt/nickel transport system permease protein [Cohaesibacter marisflavi]
MHIVDGALSNEVLIVGSAMSAVGIVVGLRKLTMDLIPAAGVLSATFFVASLIHVPLGFSSVHLILNGLAGIILGWAAFPALFVALLLQAVFFAFGGISVLGVNTLNIAAPAVLVGLMVNPFLIRTTSSSLAAVFGGFAGALAIALTTLFVALALGFSGDNFALQAKIVFVAHIPIMIIEGLLSAAAIYLIHKVKPELLHAMNKGGAR